MNNHNQPISGGSINNNNIYLPSLRYEDMSEWGKQQMDMADKILDELLLSKENKLMFSYFDCKFFINISFLSIHF